MKKGFTLTELLTTVVILAILAAIALPNFTKSADKAKASQAIAFLRAIRTGEKMYLAKNNNYWGPCAVATACTNAELETNLGVEVSTVDYGFSVTITATGFNAQALRSGNAANFIQVTEAGVFSGGGTCGSGGVSCATYAATAN